MSYILTGKFWFALLLVGVCIHYSQEASFNLPRRRRQSCSARHFQCYSGQCVDQFVRCDGTVNCEDGSDETKRTCQAFQCPSFTYQCDYGACANADAKCNKIRDCADGSDERGCPPPTSSKCKKNQFECNSGVCIDNTLLCDGPKDCDDGSDESVDSCQYVQCPSYAFRCDYGACIDKDGLCNGIKQCADGSDEAKERCPTHEPIPQPKPSVGCKLPPQPENGQYTLGGCAPPCQHVPGDILDAALLTFTCYPGFVLYGNSQLYCDDDWTAEFPTCSQTTCSALVNPSREVECTLNEQKVDCKLPVPPGTKASVKCNAFYTNDKELNYFVTTCQTNGKWSRELHSCLPKCGEPNPDGVPFVSHGKEAKLGEFPWHVGIYRMLDQKYQLVCGGNIITTRTILTVAHCFWDSGSQRQIDQSMYRIAVGKFYREWDHPNDPHVQSPEIDRIILHDRFRGVLKNWGDDIALVILKNIIEMKIAVGPICMDYDKKNEKLFSPGKSGIVMGWGITENQTQSDTLHKTTLPYVDYETCEKKTPTNFWQYLTNEKFCAGYSNGTSVCQGDSGGGFAVEFRDGKYYLMGLVSVGVPSETYGHCNIFQYATFTKVSDYYRFIESNISE